MRSLLLLLGLGLACGCGGSNHGVADGGNSDADPNGAGCHPTFGSSFIVSQFAQSAPGDGFDLNGDGKPDNAFAVVGISSGIWNNLITTGSAIFLFDVHGLPAAGTLVGDGASLDLAFYLGVSVNSDPSTYFDGTGQFLAPASQFDVSCHTTANLDSVSVAGGTIEGHKAMLGLGVHGLGILEFTRFILRGTMSADQQTFSGRLGGVAGPCGLSQLPSPAGAGSMLGFLVNANQTQPDIDVDGNGLDRIMGDGQDIASCTTGDGVLIPGADCACDPRIKDGFSGAFDFSAVPAMIVGIAQQ
jgi:hypothetical protein